MILTPASIFLAILFIVFSPSLAFRGPKDSEEDLNSIRAFYSVSRSPSKIDETRISPFPKDENMLEEDKAEPEKDVRSLENVQRKSRTTNLCWCGMTSARCCRKRTFQKVKGVQRRFAVPKANVQDEPANKRPQQEDYYH